MPGARCVQLAQLEVPVGWLQAEVVVAPAAAYVSPSQSRYHVVAMPMIPSQLLSTVPGHISLAPG